MPIWFVISGYFFNSDKDYKGLITRKVRNLLIPYLLFAVIYELIWSCMGNDQWLGIVFPTSIQIPINGALWFLPALFFAEIVSFTLLKFLPKPAAIITIILVFAFGLVCKADLPFSLSGACVGVGFYLLGVLVRAKRMYLENLSYPLTLIILAIGLLFAYINGNANLRTNEYSNIVYFLISSTFICIALLNLFRLMFINTDFHVLTEIGKDSLIYVCTNQCIILLIDVINPSSIICELLWKCVVVIVTVLIGFFMCRLISRSKLRFLIGK